jgi:hypothetical protein
MKKIVLMFVIFTAAFVYGQNSNPKIYAKEVNHDFGTIVEGEIAKYNFEVKNTGDVDLKIDRVSASCGCTAAKPEKSILKPNEKTAIQIEFNSNNRLGQQTKYVYVFSNDPTTPELKLSFTGVVVDKSVAFSKDGKAAMLKLSKNSYDFGNVEEGKVVETTVAFKNEGNAVLQITDVKTSCGCTAALLSSKELKPGESGTLRIDLDTANREGKLTRTVTLFSNDPKEPNQTFTIFVNIEKRKS